MKKIAVLLNGAGSQDGSEIQESVCTHLALSLHGFDVHFFSLEELQLRVVNHFTGEIQSHPPRTMIVESARIARGKIDVIDNCNVEDMAGLVIPGGYGTAFHFCDFAIQGAQMAVHPKIEKLIQSFYEMKKPLGAICIAPVLYAKVLGFLGIKITLGPLSQAAQAASSWGAQHIVCEEGDIVSDEKHHVVTTPAYMHSGTSVVSVWNGISKLAVQIKQWSVVS